MNYLWASPKFSSASQHKKIVDDEPPQIFLKCPHLPDIWWLMAMEMIEEVTESNTDCRTRGGKSNVFIELWRSFF